MVKTYERTHSDPNASNEDEWRTTGMEARLNLILARLTNLEYEKEKDRLEKEVTINNTEGERSSNGHGVNDKHENEKSPTSIKRNKKIVSYKMAPKKEEPILNDVKPKDLA